MSLLLFLFLLFLLLLWSSSSHCCRQVLLSTRFDCKAFVVAMQFVVVVAVVDSPISHKPIGQRSAVHADDCVALVATMSLSVVVVVEDDVVVVISLYCLLISTSTLIALLW